MSLSAVPTRLSPRAIALLAAFLALLTLAGPPPAAAQEDAILDKVERWFADTRSLKAEFLQIDQEGGYATGTVWLRRPGRVRFEYDPPVPLLIVSDGIFVMFVDTELEQVDRLPLVRSPLSILTADKVDLRRDTELRGMESDGGVLSLTLADSKAPEEGEVTLIFTENPMSLRQWILRDPTGRETRVALQNMEVNLGLPTRLFVYTDPAPRRDRNVP